MFFCKCSTISFCINRNIVECKFAHCLRRESPGSVLIETLWNVNSFTAVIPSATSSVLIETLWNVNSDEHRENMAARSINRNIVECKYSSFLRCKWTVCVLIETLWNVNKVEVEKMLQSGKVLIETLWNVNVFWGSVL